MPRTFVPAVKDLTYRLSWLDRQTGHTIEAHIVPVNAIAPSLDRDDLDEWRWMLRSGRLTLGVEYRGWMCIELGPL